MTKPTNAKSLGISPLPTGLQSILTKAAQDDSFQEELIRDRCRAVDRQGMTLNGREEAILMAITEVQLRGMIASLRGPGRRAFLRQAGASAAAALGGVVWGGCDRAEPTLVAGVRPDLPEPAETDGLTSPLPEDAADSPKDSTDSPKDSADTTKDAAGSPKDAPKNPTKSKGHLPVPAGIRPDIPSPKTPIPPDD